MSCSDQLDLRWLRTLFTELVFPNPHFCFTEEDLYMYWTSYIETHGVHSKRDRDYVRSSFELTMDCELDASKYYVLTKEVVGKQLHGIFGEEIINYK